MGGGEQTSFFQFAGIDVMNCLRKERSGVKEIGDGVSLPESGGIVLADRVFGDVRRQQ